MRISTIAKYHFSNIPKKNSLKPLILLLKPEYRIAIVGFSIVGVSSGLLMYIPQAFKIFFIKEIGQLQDKRITENREENEKILQEYRNFVYKWTAICAVSGVLGFCRRYINQNVSNRIAIRLRNSLFQKFMKDRQITSTQSSQLVHRLSNDVSLISNGLSMDILIGIRGLLTTIGGTAYLFYEALQLLPSALCVMIFFALSTRTILKYQRHYKVLETDSLTKLSELAQERLQAFRVIKVSDMEQREIDKYVAQLCRFYDNSKKHSLYQALNMGVVEGFGFASLIGILGYGSYLITIGAAEPGLISSSIYAFFVGTGLRTLISTYSELSKTAGIYQGLQELVPNIQDDPIYNDQNFIQAYQLKIQQDDELKIRLLNPPLQSSEEELAMLYTQEQIPPPKIEFKNISFGHSGHKHVLKNFNMTVESGQVVVLIGQSGSGKSTILNLLTKLNDPLSGEILIDGENLIHKDFGWIQRNVSYVPQDATIFSGTVYENIVFGNQGFDQSMERVIWAAKMAKAHDFIEDFPQGYNTYLKSDGLVSLSGGQRQRIVLARAILKNPRILIFDEATSNIDSDAESQIIQALKVICQHKTCFIVTHKIENYRQLISHEIRL